MDDQPTKQQSGGKFARGVVWLTIAALAAFGCHAIYVAVTQSRWDYAVGAAAYLGVAALFSVAMVWSRKVR